LNLKKIFCKETLNPTPNTTLHSNDRETSYDCQKKYKNEDLEKNLKHNMEDEEKIKLNSPQEY